MIMGYKCFNADLTNNYGFQFEIGRTYSVSGTVKAGTNGNGYHMCKNIEDTFRFYGVRNPEVAICEVIGSGQKVLFHDEYNGYYDMYSVERIKLVRQLSRDEIVELGLSMGELRARRFVEVFKLNPEEIDLFKRKFDGYPQVLQAIAYYQEGDAQVYQRGYALKKTHKKRRTRR